MEETTTTETPGGAPVQLSPAAAVLERRAAVVDRLREADRDVARAAAVRLERVNEFRLEAEKANTDPDALRGDAIGAQARVRFRLSPDIERRSVKAQLAMALRISERAAETQLAMAEALATELTATMEALRAGEVTEWHARLIWGESCHLPAEDRLLFETQALVAAGTLSTARLKGKLRDIAERLHPDTAIERHQAAVEARDVWVDPLPDGTAVFSVRHSAETVIAVQNGIEHCARGVAADPDESRTLPQIRADLAIEFLANGELGGVKITPTAHIVVPALSIAGIPEELAILEGYGPIDPVTARQLLADADELIRLVTHPVTGTILAVDSYKPPTALRRWLQIRDQTWRTPGCGRRAATCEIDHTLERAKDHGPTAFDNLAHLCVNHHKLKTVTGLTYRHLDRTGTLEWTTPMGQNYITEPAVKMLGAPHLDDAIRQALLEHDPPPPEYDDRIPDDLYGEWQAAFDDELKADHAQLGQPGIFSG
ncbi:DUF222 domain-containing protein [Lysobacter korlensis]|uniref:DUF222 domain-containing protein n=1 Tax=Lysobacter korlensis TaxID=553636 RepID=A0ABV6RPA5_9GAMM